MIPLADQQEFAYGVPPLMAALLWSTPVVAGLVGLTVLGTLVAWLSGYWWFSGRLHYTLRRRGGPGVRLVPVPLEPAAVRTLTQRGDRSIVRQSRCTRQFRSARLQWRQFETHAGTL